MDYPFKGIVTTQSNHHHLEEEDEDGGGSNKSMVVIEKEHMFDKVVTPSDVGKLNRLVIPKQHAEKYFPLDSSNNEKGLLLNFEDRTGKPWRFRYSYWNSSQSYVMTKGWSRFVKEKKLDAGDIVSFQRGVGDIGKDKLFIDWRRRPDSSGLHQYQYQYNHNHNRTIHSPTGGVGWTSNSSPTFVLRSHPYTHPHPHPHPHPYSQPPYPYPTPQGGGGVGGGGVWDHLGNTNSSNTHLSTMSLMNVVPSQSHHPFRRGASIGGGGGQYGFGFGNVVNPYPMTGSLIFLRSSSSSSSVSSTGVGVQQNATAAASSVTVEDHHHHHNHHDHHHHQGGGGGGGGVMDVQREESGVEHMVFESVPVVQGKAAAKRLRLFGVNMDCPISHQTHDFDILSSSLASSSTPNYHHQHHPHHHHQQHEHEHEHEHEHDEHEQHQHTPATPMGPPTSTTPQPLPLQLRSLYNGTLPDKGKSSTSSSSMSLDLDI